jgi:hypothetical protein
MRPDSDMDVLIVMPENVHRRRTAQDIHEQLFSFPVPILVSCITGCYGRERNLRRLRRWVSGRLEKGRKAKGLYLGTAASGLKEPVKGLYFIPVPERLG